MKKLGLASMFAVLTLLFILSLLAMNFTLATEEQELKSDLLGLMSVKQGMLDASIGVMRVSDLINEGYTYINNQNYNKTRETISSVYKVRDAAFSAKSQLSLARSMYAEINNKNVSLFETTQHIIEWNLNYSQREFENENFEEALGTTEGIINNLLNSISARYDYLNDTIIALEEKISLLGLNTYRITTLKGMLAQALDEGKLDELDMIEEEVKNINTSTSYYEQVKLSIPELESKNLSAQRINDGLAEAGASLNIADYASATGKLESLVKIINQTLQVKERITEFDKFFNQEKTITQQENKGTNWTETENLLEKARYELAVGNYEKAESQIAQAEQVFESAKAKSLVEGATKKAPLFSLEKFVAKNWQYILAFIFAVLLVLKLTQKAWSYEIRKRKLMKLEKELKVSEKMIQELQKKYFVHRKMSRQGYDEAYEALQDRTIILKERIMLLNKKIKKEEKDLKRKD